MRLLRQLLPLLLLLTAAPSAAQNLLANPSFDDDLGSWRNFAPAEELAWSAEDADGSPDSGSVGIALPLSSQGTGIFQIIDLPPGEGWFASVKVKMLPGDPGEAGAELTWYDGSDTVIGGERLYVGATAGWVEVSGEGWVPPGATRAGFSTGGRRAPFSEATQPFEVHLDDTVLMIGEAPDTPPDANRVENADFDSSVSRGWVRQIPEGSTAEWSPVDSDDSLISGSLLLTSLISGKTVYNQSLGAIEPGEPWEVAADTQIAGPGSSRIELDFIVDLGRGPDLERVSVDAVWDVEGWVTLSGTGVAPEGATSLGVRIVSLNESGRSSETVVTHFDKVVVKVPEAGAVEGAAVVLLVLACLVHVAEGSRTRAGFR